jgi:hypothetical protein
VDPERLRAKRPDAGPLSYFLFGTPEHVAAAIRDHVGDAAVRTVWLGASIAGLPEDLAVRHIQTICTRLRPLLADGARAGWSLPTGKQGAREGTPAGFRQQGRNEEETWAGSTARSRS